MGATILLGLGSELGLGIVMGLRLGLGLGLVMGLEKRQLSKTTNPNPNPIRNPNPNLSVNLYLIYSLVVKASSWYINHLGGSSSLLMTEEG
jgi:hypothetical protein